MIFRFRYQQAGGHTHVRVFAGRHEHGGLGKCGDLVFRNEEWAEFKATLNGDHRFQFVDETTT